MFRARGDSLVEHNWSFYGAAEATQASNIEAKFSKVLQAKGFTVITKDEIRGMSRKIDSNQTS